ncbi:MAG: DUF2784 family protein [Spirochaetales bacterium]|nr:DUF2784 family protein [Spirochaetales bacterium]MCP5484950.1 DUF2784 family protein [Spirochaetales bacterium]
MLSALNIFFWVLHSAVIVLNLFGWAFRRLRVFNLALLSGTLAFWMYSGIALGFFGYCPLTDWHWDVLRRLGHTDLPNSFIKALLDGATGLDWDPFTVDVITGVSFSLAFLLSIFVNVRDWRRGVRPWKQDLRAFLYLLPLMAGLIRAIQLRWVCDDAFISFRYAAHAARGLGLVFNAGERVEGMTNLFWTVLLIPFAAFDMDLVLASQAMGIICFAVLLGVIYVLRDKTSTMAPLFLPALALHYHMLVFATSGLETMAFTLAVTTALLLETKPTKRFPGRLYVSAFALGIACGLRPDGFVFFVIVAIFRLLPLPGSPRALLLRLASLSPAILMGLAILIFRITYYGALVPNTFYSRSASEAYPSQGLVYVLWYFASYWFCALCLLGSALALFNNWRRAQPIPRRAALLLVACLVWSTYVIWVGGDFMFGRFLVPITPILFVSGEWALRQFDSGRRLTARPAGAVIVAALSMVAVLARYDPYRGRDLPLLDNIAEENRIYTPERVARLERVARDLGPVVRQSGVRLGFVGAQAALIYYLRPDFALEAESGLTDRTVARQEVSERGRVAHEKQAPLEYLQERRVHILLRPQTPDSPLGDLPCVTIQGLIGTFPVITNEADVLGPLLDSGKFRRCAGPP